MRLVLASKSPRRSEILKMMGFDFIVCEASGAEIADFKKGIGPAVETLSYNKANEVFLLKHSEDVVLGSDTVVAVDRQVLGKPKDEAEAKSMLKSLQGRSHAVYTGVAILSKSKTTIFHTKTKVEFWDLSDRDIEEYIKTGEPFDKAGAYGIQGAGARLVKSIEGDFYAVMGLPASRVFRELSALGFPFAPGI